MSKEKHDGPDFSSIGMNRASKVTDARNFVTNHFVLSDVHYGMGSPQPIISRLPELRMTIASVRAVIADSDASARRHLRGMLESEGGVEVVADCSDSQGTIAAVQLQKPDLLLLDVQLSDANGFQVLESIAVSDRPVAIFTSHDRRYAMQAFEARALDYLLKPLDPERVRTAIGRARIELLRMHDRRLTHSLLNLLAGTTAADPTKERRLVVKSEGRVIFVDMDEIDWLEAAGNYVKLHVGRESYVMREAISRMAERLDPTLFARIHRSIIVNVRKIKALQPCNRGEYMVTLKDGKELSCSRGYRAKLQELIAIA